MAFNNPSSTKPVTYASATKSLGYLCKVVVNACSRDEDDDEHASLMKKKKSTKENRTMVASLCACLCCLVAMVGLFVLALLSLSYPHPVPHGAHSLGGKGKDGALARNPSSPRSGAFGERGRLANVRTKKVKKNVDGLIGQWAGKEFGGR